MNITNNSNGNGNSQKPRFTPEFLRNLFPPYRRSFAAKTPPPSNGNYRAQDSVAYSSDGIYSHGKPPGGETQFGIGGKVPAPAFGMTDATIAAFKVQARVAAYVGEALETVRIEGARLFDARYAELKAQFQGRVLAARRLIEPLEAQSSALRSEADALPTLVRNERDKYSLPQDWRLLAILVLLGLWGFVTYSEWINAASRQLFLLQDWTKAKLATVPWLAVGVVLEWIIISTVGAAGIFWRKVWRVVSLTSIFAYAALYACRHGASVDVDVAANLASALSGNVVASNSAGLDQALYFGQLFFGLVCGATLLEAVLHLMIGREVLVPNPDRQRLNTEMSALLEKINAESAPLSKAEGHLAEYEASRAAFIDFGVRAFRAAKAEQEIFEVDRKILEQQRDLLQRKRQALLS